MWENMIIHYEFRASSHGGVGERRNHIIRHTVGAYPVPGTRVHDLHHPLRWTTQFTLQKPVINLETGKHQYKCLDRPALWHLCIPDSLHSSRPRPPEVPRGPYKPKPLVYTYTDKWQLRETRKLFEKRNPFLFLKKMLLFFCGFSEKPLPPPNHSSNIEMNTDWIAWDFHVGAHVWPWGP